MSIGIVSRNQVPMVITFDESLVNLISGALEDQIRLSSSVYQMFGEYKSGEDDEL